MAKGYRPLTCGERCQSHALRKSGISDAAIARQLGRDRTTVWREVRRNSGKRGYRHGQAQGKAEGRRSARTSSSRGPTTPGSAASLRETPDGPRSTRRGPSPARPQACLAPPGAPVRLGSKGTEPFPCGIGGRALRFGMAPGRELS